MFRKLVSNLPFSPALIHDVGFYASRLRKEEATRRLSVLFVTLAIVMQSLAVFSPPNAVNASSEQDIIQGGVSSLDDYLGHYDRNKDDVKDIMTALGVTRSEIAASNEGFVHSSDAIFLLTRYGQLAASDSETLLTYQRSVGGTGNRYFSPLKQMTEKPITLSGWIGQSDAAGWFALIKTSGGIALKTPPSPANAATSDASLVQKVTAINLTQGVENAANSAAKPYDRIAYTLKTTNNGSRSTTATFSTHLGDTLEYANLVDAGGATLDSTTKVLAWPHAQLRPGESQERTYVVQTLAETPSTSTGSSNPASFDCRIVTTYGETISVPIDCPPAKGIESILALLPSTGAFANIVFAMILIAVTGFFYLRTRQMKREIRIIRHNMNTGIM